MPRNCRHRAKDRLLLLLLLRLLLLLPLRNRHGAPPLLLLLLLLQLLPRGDDGERPLPPDHHCGIILQETRVEDGGAGGAADRGGPEGVAVEHVDSSAAGRGDPQFGHEEEEEIDGEGLKER